MKPDARLGTWSIRSAACFVLMVALAACYSAPPTVEAAASTRAGGLEDDALVTTVLELVQSRSGGATVRVSIYSSIDQPVSIDLVSLGGVRLAIPAGFSEVEPGYAYFAGDTPNRRFSRHASLRAAQTATFDVPVEVGQTAGSVAVGLVPHDAAVDAGDGSILHLARRGSEVISGATSALDLEADLLRLEKGLKKEADAEESEPEDPSVEALFRRGATTRVIPAENKIDEQTISLEGQIEITARAPRPQPRAPYGDVRLPARFIEVEFFDQDGARLTSLGKATTNAQGLASIQAPASEEDGTGQDVLVRAYASGPYARVVRDARGTPVQTIESQMRENMANGGRIILTSDRRHSNNRAFEVHEAIDREARYLVGLSPGHRPTRVIVRYPRVVRSSRTGSAYGTGTIWLLDQDGHDWDNIQHEYGHHLGATLGIGRSQGGLHMGSNNLCQARTSLGRQYGKEWGVNLAFSESWPTAMAVINQREQNSAALGIAFVGDTRFTNTNAAGDPGLNYDLENTGPRVVGEATEYSLMETIWDAYDANNENADGMTIPARDIWHAIIQGGREPFHASWNALQGTRSYAERTQMGRMIAWRRMSGAPSAPASESRHAGTTPLTLRWEAAEGCLGNAGMRYQIVFTNEATGEVRWRSAFEAATSRVLTDAERDAVFAGPRGERLRWTVVARDTEAPQTGDYNGGSAIIVDDAP
jgi:hypothetical protein